MLFYFVTSIEEEANEYITDIEKRLESELKPSDNTKSNTENHAGNILKSEEWWKTQDKEHTVSTISEAPFQVLRHDIYTCLSFSFKF